ncbi:hypothetical protein NA56DRAFT_728138 [Hyaloscypha hepaticicola]|uniref:BTB domain-containing protein n=1 Tax=Hyaloscypha hepaticicola TaxID=2082293 RepID=A0A2J6PUF9_9HELO|nr:hypothetical protein NA56DRAFT_728138 [Hyaloscypha hepaticicola]
MESTLSDQTLDLLKLEKQQVNEYFDTPINILVVVGPAQASWRLPAELLCDKLPGFAPAVRRSVQENNALSLYISKGDPSVFAAVVDWLLSGQLQCHKPHESVDSSEEHHCLHRYRVHTFAERYHSEKLCNAATRRARLCIRLSTSLPNSAEIQNMFSQSPSNQCFQNLIVSEVVNTFFILSMDDVRNGMSELIETISSHPGFHSLFLIAVKARYQA